MNNSFDQFIKDIMTKLLFGTNKILEVLRKQYEKATIIKKEHTGHGYYIYFNVPKELPSIGNYDFQFGDVIAHIDGLKNGVGFLLFISNGRIDLLEGYTYDEPFPKDINNYQISYNTWEKRDYTILRKKWPSLCDD